MSDLFPLIALGGAITVAVGFAAWWLIAHLTAPRCPQCGSRWRTWPRRIVPFTGTQWECRRCDKRWFVPEEYRK